jgi:hypothetical protein
LVLLVALVPAPAAWAQTTARLSQETTFHKDPAGVRLVTLGRNTPVAVIRTRNTWTEVRVEGWIWSRSLAGTTRDGFDLVVTADGGENLRAQPDGQILGRAVVGALFDRVRTEGGWTRVRRVGWVATSAVPTSAVTPPAQEAPAPAAVDSAAPAAGTRRPRPTRTP